MGEALHESKHLSMEHGVGWEYLAVHAGFGVGAVCLPHCQSADDVWYELPPPIKAEYNLVKSYLYFVSLSVNCHVPQEPGDEHPEALNSRAFEEIVSQTLNLFMADWAQVVLVRYKVGELFSSCNASMLDTP